LLVVSEVALAFLLLVGAGLVGKSFHQLSRVDLGFRPEGVLTFEVLLPDGKYPTPRTQRTFYENLVERARSLPGVQSAAAVLLRPLWGPIGMDWPSMVEGQSKEEASRNPLVNLEAVTPDYFRTMGIALLEGRDFTPLDSEGAPGVVVVSKSMADRFWSDENPIGKRLKLRLPGSEYDDQWLEVVGVVSDARYRELEAIRWDVYLSYLQCPYSVRHLVVRSSSDPLDLVGAMRREVHALDPDLPVSDVAAMNDLVSASMGGARFRTRLLFTFAFAALFLAAVGLYGLMAYTVNQTTQEIGIRLALGAQRADIVRAVVRSGFILTLSGMAIGLGVSGLATRMLSGLLFDVSPTDATTYAIVSFVLFGTALLASLVPALRAAMVDPLESLRYE
jgi:putative ABC transport system permease protein